MHRHLLSHAFRRIKSDMGHIIYHLDQDIFEVINGGRDMVTSIKAAGPNRTLPGRLANRHSVGRRPGEGPSVILWHVYAPPQVIAPCKGKGFQGKEAALAGAWCVNMQGTGGYSRPAFTRW